MPIALALLVYCYAFQGMRGLWERDEGRYTAVALRMVETRDWIKPQMHHEVSHFSKPPMIYWLTAVSFQLFGKNEFAARLPSSSAYLATIITMFFLGRVFLTQNQWAAALIYAMLMFPFGASNILTTDSLLTFFETAAVASFAYAYWQASPKDKFKGTLLMWLFFSLAFMTKGPPGVLPFLSILAFLFFRPKTNARPFAMHWLWGTLIFLGVGTSWYFLIIFGEKHSAGYFLWNEFILRIFSGGFRRNPQWYGVFMVYLPVLLLGSLPWTFVILKGFYRSLRSFKKIAQTDNGQNLFLLFWLLIPMAIFTLARSKLPLYVLPLFAPLAILAAKQLEYKNFSFQKFRYLLGIWIIAMLVLRVSVAHYPLKSDARAFSKKLKEVYPGHMREILFIDRVPIMGLYFYTGAEVERLTFEDNSIDLELVEKDKGPRIWLVYQEQAIYFEEKARANNKELELINTFSWYNNSYHLYLDTRPIEKSDEAEAKAEI